MLHGRLPEADQEALVALLTDADLGERRPHRPPLRPGLPPRRPRRLGAGRRAFAASQWLGPGYSAAASQHYRARRARSLCPKSAGRLHTDLLRANDRLGTGHGTADIYRRPAPLRNHPDRANPGQPFAQSSAPANCTWARRLRQPGRHPPTRLRGLPAARPAGPGVGAPRGRAPPGGIADAGCHGRPCSG